MALNELASNGSKKLRYSLPNGIVVEYPASDQAYYFASIIKSVFEHDKHVRRLIVGLSGKNLRRALEIFLEFCTSAHIGEDEILKIRRSEGQYVLPLSLVTTVLLRLNRRFYDGDAAYLRNIIGINDKDRNPSYFARLMVLRWLHLRLDQFGPTRLRGYHPIRDIKSEFSAYGIDSEIVVREVEYLAKSNCIIAEDFRTEGLADDDLVKLGPAGHVHIHLMSNVHYLAAVAEDTWFDNEVIAKGIASRIKDQREHYHVRTVLYNAVDVMQYLHGVRSQKIVPVQNLVQLEKFSSLTDLASTLSAVGKFEKELVSGPWVGLPARHPVGSSVEGKVVAVKGFGVLVEIEPNVTGLVHSSKLPSDYASDPRFSVGAIITVKINNVDQFERRLGLRLISNGGANAQ